MRALPFLSLFCIFSFVSARSGAQVTWQQTKGPEGGAVSAVCVDSIGHVLICTKAGGIFESGDSGNRWVAHNQGLPTLFFRALEAGSRGYAYALSNAYGIFRMKRDDNPTWVLLDTTSQFPYGIADMAVDASGNLFIATSSLGILVSYDNGDHFTATNTGIDSADLSKNAFIKFLAIATDGQMYALSSRRQPYRSTDHGQHWTALAKSAAIGEPFAFYSLPKGSLMIGDIKGKAFLSTDGTSWQQVLTVDTSYIYDFFYSPKNGHTFARYSNGLLFRSTDMGLTWETIVREIEGGEYFPTAVNKAGVIFSGVDYDGMLRSFDDGESFETINNGLIGSYIAQLQVDAQNNLYANSNERIYRSSDQGQHWQTLSLEIHDILMAPVYSLDSSGVIYANDNGWVDISYDSGKTWTKILQTPRPQDPRMITYALASTKEQTLAATNRGLFSTVDHGHTWKNISPNGDSGQYITAVIGADGALYTQDGPGAIYRSTNAGLNWDPPVSRSGQLQFVMKDGLTMFRANNERVERSTDAGLDWTTLSVDAAREAANSFQLFGVMIDNKNQLFACSDSGIYLSKDLGDTWIPSSEGLHGPSEGRISGATSVCQDRSGNYFAASHGQGVFISPASHNDVKWTARANNGTVQCYPNPAADHAVLSFTLDAPAMARYEILDIAGRIITQVSDIAMSAGAHDLPVDVDSVPSGNYLCTLTLGTERRSVWITVSH